MDTRLQPLLDAANRARANAHAPYSGFRVGAAVRDAEGRIHAGANLENAAYPLGLCAEAAALAVMVAAGGKAVVEALIVADGPATVTPCGGCRQRLREFAGPATPVHLAEPTRLRETLSLEALLPRAFELTAAR